ncbi:peptidase inhibitor [Streptomyces sp. NPDC127114]|uniref:peptidase inhibitor n=1 Tax=Streptomyces sp. NPDC127114 TaxID=3345366 RepID=UPI00362CCCF4
MNLKRKMASMALAGGLAVTGLAAATTPATAVGGCGSNQLCLYRSTEFRTMAFETTNTYKCWKLIDYGLTDPWNGISSYVNNLPVQATLWEYTGSLYLSAATISPGHYSSNSTSHYAFLHSEFICTGGADPRDFF